MTARRRYQLNHSAAADIRKSAKKRALISDRRPLVENLTYVRFFEAASTNTLAAHPRPTLAAQHITPGPLGVVFADPTDSMTYATSGVHVNEVQASELKNRFGGSHVQFRHPPG